MHLIFEFLPFLLIAVVLIVVAFASGKKKSKILQSLAKEFSGKISIFPVVTLKGKFNGVNFKLWLIPASRHSPPYLYVYFYKRPSFNLIIRKESSLMRFGKKFGMVQAIKTRDPDFDKEFLCISKNKGTVLSILSRLEVKQAIRDIFSRGFTQLRAKKEFSISKPNYRIREDITLDNIRFILERLYIISRGY